MCEEYLEARTREIANTLRRGLGEAEQENGIWEEDELARLDLFREWIIVQVASLTAQIGKLAEHDLNSIKLVDRLIDRIEEVEAEGETET